MTYDIAKEIENDCAAAGCPNERIVMRFMDCPLGTRFRYKEHKIPVYVILSHYGEGGCGLVAKWEGVNSGARMQQIFSAENSEIECKNLEIVIVA